MKEKCLGILFLLLMIFVMALSGCGRKEVDYSLDQNQGNAGITDISVSGVRVLEWFYYIESTGETVATEYDGYVISFDRVVNGTPVYQDLIGNVDNLEDTLINNPADSYEVYVSDNGVVEASWSVKLFSTGEEENNVELLSWKELIEAADRNIAEYYEKYPSHSNKIEFDQARLTYYSVKDEGRENSYKYIPVWVFSKGQKDMDSSGPTQLVIINEMDGSILDLIEPEK